MRKNIALGTSFVPIYQNNRENAPPENLNLSIRTNAYWSFDIA